MLKPTPLRVAILCSHRAPGVADLLADPDRGTLYEIACVMTTNRDLADRDMFVDAGITCITRPQPPRDLRQREAYDAATAGYLEVFHIDLVVLCCYLRILTAPMLDAFPGRIINLHDSDLAITSDGRPRYVGLRSTLEAIAEGECETRATAHWVSEEVDQGPLLLRSGAFPVSSLAGDARRSGAKDVMKAYAYAHREWVIRTAWGPLMRDAIHMVAGEPAP